MGYTQQAYLTLHPKDAKRQEGMKKKYGETLKICPVDLDPDPVDSKPRPVDLSDLKDLDSQSRLFIHGHGSHADPEHIKDDKGNKLHYKDLAKMLAGALTNDSIKQKSSEHCLKISLIMCESTGFAQRLHHELSTYGIYSEISARTVPVSLDLKSAQKYTVDKTLPKQEIIEIARLQRSNSEAEKLLAGHLINKHKISKQATTKYIYYWDDKNQQAYREAYDETFLRSKLVEAIEKMKEELSDFKLKEPCKDSNSSTEKKEKIDALIEEIKKAESMEKLSRIIEDIIEGKVVNFNYGKNSLTCIRLEKMKVYAHPLKMGATLQHFEQHSYKPNEFAHKKFCDAIYKAINECRSQSKETPHRIQGLNDLLSDISKHESTADKASFLSEQIEKHFNKYNLNAFRKFPFFSFSTTPSMTNFCSKLSGDLDKIIQAQPLNATQKEGGSECYFPQSPRI